MLKIDFTPRYCSTIKDKLVATVRVPHGAVSHITVVLVCPEQEYQDAAVAIQNYLSEDGGETWINAGGFDRPAMAWGQDWMGSWHSHEVDDPKHLRRLADGSFLRSELTVGKPVVGRLVQSVLVEESE